MAITKSLQLFFMLMLFGVILTLTQATRYNSLYSSYGYHKASPRPNPKTKPKPEPRPPQTSIAAEFMRAQNAARATVGLKALKWDPKLQAYAQSWANERASSYGNCELRHSNGPYGENIFWGSGKAWSPAEASIAWVDERRWYNYWSNSCHYGQQCGHYTQIVWRDSLRIGCARAICTNGDVFMTCNYDPPGNYIGQKPY